MQWLSRVEMADVQVYAERGVLGEREMMVQEYRVGSHLNLKVMLWHVVSAAPSLGLPSGACIINMVLDISTQDDTQLPRLLLVK